MAGEIYGYNNAYNDDFYAQQYFKNLANNPVANTQTSSQPAFQ